MPFALHINFVLVLIGTLGSLYFSEVMKFPPCTLCWYQRVCLYPLVFILGAAIWTSDRHYKRYVLPVVFVGLAIAIYHNLLYFGFISEALAPCTQGLSCSAKQLELFGFITIPLMSLAAFVTTLVLTWLDKTNESSSPQT
jgi:disulfide bond formation protein DsbB